MRNLLIFLLIITTASSQALAFSSPYLSKSRTSAIIIDLKTGNPVAELNPDLQLNPASLTKLATAYAALKLLGPSHRIETTICSPENPSDGVYKKIFVIGRGDPLLVEEDYWRIAGELKAYGVRSVKDIIIDDSYFDGGYYPNPNNDLDSDRAFVARTSALPINFDAVAITALPNGDAAISPDIEQIKVSTRWSKKGATRISCTGDKLPQTCVLSGKPPKKTKRWYRRLTNPPMVAGLALASLLKSRGVTVIGTVRKAKAPAQCQPILTNKSKSMAFITRLMAIYSSNFIAEQLVKYIGARRFGAPGTTEKGTRAIKQSLETAGVAGETMENGSGLSYKNSFSARQFAKILHAAYIDRKIQPEFFAMLARDDDDESTLRAWHFPPQFGLIRGKTGTLSKACALAGYMRGRAFAVITNDPPKGPHKARKGVVDLLQSMMSGR